MQLFVRTLYGQRIIIEAEPTDTTEIVRAKIHAGGISADYHQLIHAGKQLEEGRTLSDYNGRNESIIMICQRLRGG